MRKLNYFRVHTLYQPSINNVLIPARLHVSIFKRSYSGQHTLKIVNYMLVTRIGVMGMRSYSNGYIRLILCLCFRASLIYINKCPTRYNTKQSIYYSASSLYMFRVSTTPTIRNTQNSNYSLRYWSYLCG